MTQLQLEDELGRGAYGTVKKVLHKPTNVAMAMKVSPHKLPFMHTVPLRVHLAHLATSCALYPVPYPACAPLPRFWTTNRN